MFIIIENVRSVLVMDREAVKRRPKTRRERGKTRMVVSSGDDTVLGEPKTATTRMNVGPSGAPL
jgi:hypothetical protein